MLFRTELNIQALLDGYILNTVTMQNQKGTFYSKIKEISMTPLLFGLTLSIFTVHTLSTGHILRVSV